MTTLPPIDTSRRLPQHEPHSIMAASQTSATYTGSLQELDPSGKPGKFTKMVSELGKRLSGRTTREELVRSNIIKEEVVNIPNALASAKIALEKEREKDKLSSKLQRRPSKTDLKLRNILRVDSNDSIVQAQGGEMLKTIKFDETATKLRSILKKRPERAELEHQNILKSPEGVDPSLAAMVEKMKRVQLENQLENMIRERPSPEEIDMRINFNETVEILPTFRRSEYNRRPDTNATFRKLTPKMKMEIREELNNFKKHEMPVHESSLRNTCFH